MAKTQLPLHSPQQQPNPAPGNQGTALIQGNVTLKPRVIHYELVSDAEFGAVLPNTTHNLLI